MQKFDLPKSEAERGILLGILKFVKAGLRIERLRPLTVSIASARSVIRRAFALSVAMSGMTWMNHEHAVMSAVASSAPVT